MYYVCHRLVGNQDKSNVTGLAVASVVASLAGNYLCLHHLVY